MKIIVNADDYGRNKETTDAIIECFLQNKITSTTLMVVHEDCFRAADIAKDKGFPVGLHLCLDEGIPLSNPLAVSSLLDKNGYLNVDLKRLYLGKIRANELYIEIEKQFEKFAELGLIITHLDSHHHLHCHPLVLWALTQLKKKLSFPLKIRSIRNFECAGGLKEYGWLKLAYKNMVHIMQKKLFVTTDYFSSIVKYSDKSILGIEDFLNSFAEKKTSIEIMCHPGEPEEHSHLMRMESLSTIALKSKAEFIDYSRLLL